MAQFGRPSTDTTREGYTDNGGGTTNIFNAIDETSANDSDFIQSALAPTSDVYVTKLTTVEDPQSSSGHNFKFRIQKDASGGAQIDCTVQLRQGYVNESTLGTLIATSTVTNVANGWATTTLTLSGAEADAITNYADLFLRVIANQV